MRGHDGHSEQQQFCLYTVHSPGTIGNCRDQLEHDVDNCAVEAQEQPVDSVLSKAQMNVTGQNFYQARIVAMFPNLWTIRILPEGSSTPHRVKYATLAFTFSAMVNTHGVLVIRSA